MSAVSDQRSARLGNCPQRKPLLTSDFCLLTSTRTAFTLVELLVVIVIIALLAALLLAGLKSVRQKGHRTQCASNLRQVYTSSYAFAADHEDELPPRWGGPWNPTHLQSVTTYQGFMLLINENYLTDYRVLFCPNPNGYTPAKHWPQITGTTTNYLCSYVQREEKLVSPIPSGYPAWVVGWSTMAEPQRTTGRPDRAWAGDDQFVVVSVGPPATVALRVRHGDGWNIARFDGSVRFVNRTLAIETNVAWSADYSGQAKVWAALDAAQ